MMRNRRHLGWLGLGAFLGVAAVSLLAFVASTALSPSDQAKIEQSARKAIVLDATMCNMPAGWDHGKLPADLRDRWIAKSSSDLQNVLRGDALNTELQLLQRYLDAESADGGAFVQDSGGVNNIKLDKPVVDRDTATITATGEQWNHAVARDDNGKVTSEISPRSQISYTLTLTKIDDAWYVTQFNWAFSGGTGP
jgi:hypothetical protein